MQENRDQNDPPRHNPPPWSTRALLLFAALFLALQLAMPLRALFHHPADTRTDFSWDMFASRRDCGQCRLIYTRNDKKRRKASWGLFYKSTFHVARTRNRERLPLLARELCKREASQGRNIQVFVDCSCRYNGEEEIFDLDPYGKNYCTEEAAQRYD